MKGWVIIILLLFSSVASAQTKDPGKTKSVEKVINQLFNGMRKGDSAMVSSSFSTGMIMQTISNQNGESTLKTDKPDGFLKR